MEDAGATLIASHSGVRGRPGVGLTPEVVARAIGSMLDLLERDGLPAVVGVARDERPSGEELLRQAVGAATGRGATVVDFGVVSTPTAKVAARETGLSALVVVTGSHLGPDWNGIKLMAGPRLAPLDVAALPPPAAALRPSAPGARNGGRTDVSFDDTAARRHAAALCAAADAEAIRAAGPRVRLEGGAGAAGALALRELGCRAPSEGADVALLLDADGDRLELADERGTPVDPEATLCLAALGVDAHTVVKGADTSRTIDLVIAQRGGRVHVTQPGELHLLEATVALGADIAGEGNGGVMVPAVGLARDGLAAAVAILGLLARTGVPLSELVAGLPRLARRRFTVPCAGAAGARSALEALAEATGQPLADPREGVHEEHADSSWTLVRQSATEPVLRVTVESPEAATADALEAELRARLADRRAQPADPRARAGDPRSQPI